MIAKGKESGLKAIIHIVHYHSEQSEFYKDFGRKKKQEPLNLSQQTKNLLQDDNTRNQNKKVSNKVETSPESMISVQYNPSSIKIDVQVEEPKTSGQTSDMQAVLSKMGGNTSYDFHVSLVFDGVETSVKMNRFLSFLMTSEDQMMRFCWGKSAFEGVVTSFQGKYHQFDEKGEPTYATVELGLKGEIQD